MKILAAAIVNFFIQERIVPKEESEIYEYGFEILIENTVITIMLLAVGIFLKSGLETVIYLSVFCGLRRYCGGYHAKTRRGCHAATFLSYLLFLTEVSLFREIKQDLWWLGAVIYMSCVMIIVLLAPIEHKNKPLTDQVRRTSRRKSILWTMLLGVVMFKMYQKIPEVSFAILVSLIEVALLMIIGRKGYV